MNNDNFYLRVGDTNTTKKESLNILDELCKQNPDTTVKEFLEKNLRIRMWLV